MKLWWLVESARLAAEIVAVEALAGNEGWFDLKRWSFHEKMFCTEGVMTAHGHRCPVRLIYPDQSPEVPAWVKPQDKARWRPHQYGKGVLCLELRPDNWNAAATGPDVLRSAYNLFSIENPLGGGKTRAPSAHDVANYRPTAGGKFLF